MGMRMTIMTVVTWTMSSDDDDDDDDDDDGGNLDDDCHLFLGMPSAVNRKIIRNKLSELARSLPVSSMIPSRHRLYTFSTINHRLWDSLMNREAKAE